MRQLFPFFILTVLCACQKDQDTSDPVQVQLMAHTWVLDSSNMLTITNGTGDKVITSTKGDSSQTITYRANTFVTSDRQVTETKHYRRDRFNVYYWEGGYHEHSEQIKYIIAVDDSELIESTIINQISPGTTTTSALFFYRAK